MVAERVFQMTGESPCHSRRKRNGYPFWGTEHGTTIYNYGFDGRTRWWWWWWQLWVHRPLATLLEGPWAFLREQWSVWRVNPKKGGVWQLVLRAQIKKSTKRKLVQVANLPTCRDGTLLTKGPFMDQKTQRVPCCKVESNGLGATVPSILTVRTCCSNSPSGKFRQENKSEDQRTKCLQWFFFKRRPQRLEVPGHGLVWSIMFFIVEIT